MSAQESEKLANFPSECLEVKPLCEKILSYFPNADIDQVQRAYLFSKKHHEGQFRRSGEPYISHPVGVSEILADLRLDLPTIMTGLLHDTVEDTEATLEDIEREFGQTVAELVDGVTKITQLSFKNTHEKQSENIRKMIVAMGKDVRVILVKLADRLHNMRTLGHMPYEKQKRIGQETLEIYAPLASRLGISSIKMELEDLSFRFTHPDRYYELVQKVSKKRKEREKYIDDVKKILEDEIGSRFKGGFEIQGRPKHFYSIYKKMAASNLDYEQVYDLLAFRVIVDNIPQCYEILGHIHTLWKPIPGRFKDYIAIPKANNYQSLHTTVVGPGAERIEIQIRTHEMHLVAERGIAAHWKYKSSGKVDVKMEEQMEWLQELVSLHQQSGSSGEFLENIKTDLFDSHIYVFTPNGEVKEFREGATPIDFAYAIHTDVGNHCVAARVNGKMVPLRTRMKSGDTVEVLTSKNKTPSKDWLKYCVTSKAKSKIRSFVQEEERKRARQIGQDLLEKEFRKYGMSLGKNLTDGKINDIEELKKTGANNVEDLYVRVGYGKMLPKQVVKAVAPDAKTLDEKKEEESFLSKAYKSAVQRKKKSRSIISVDGMDDILVRFAKCCNPIPGDPIKGFISRGRGITIHKADCEKIFAIDHDREVDVAWTVKSAPEGVERMARVRVVAQDVPGLLRLMSEVFSSLGINIYNAQIRTTKDRKAVCLFDVAVKDTAQLSKAMQNLEKIKGVLGVTRVTQI
ncbi:MAG: bifunctional (p)ppGpp synthetase/guanosine-3',5'-bis(diphosphate) 3'-pyrophosphohydrolase [Bdellovibrionales bacterium]|nr:bifunctional (p)ppGpp synthetase/guanosine-3',5'-bis(diphosphate) 3'-pyrophosphohydrolase [Bdellovibrionales bacterium]